MLDYSTKTILPALVDCHVHLAFSGTVDQAIRSRQLDYPFHEARPVIAKHIRDLARHGVLYARDGGDYGGYALRYLKKEVQSLPVRVHAAGKAWHARGRYGKLIGRSPREGVTLSREIELDQDPKDHVKVVQSGINSLKVYGQETPPSVSGRRIGGFGTLGRAVGPFRHGSCKRRFASYI